MDTPGRRVVAVMSSDTVHRLKSIRDFRPTKRSRTYVAVARCGEETTGPLVSVPPDHITCPTCRKELP